MARKTPETLRSYRWFGTPDLRAFGHRSRTLQMGYGPDDFMGKPVIGIINTWSEAQPCHMHFRDRAEAVKRGVWQAGGFPIELPAMSLSENYVKPTTMLYRNLRRMGDLDALSPRLGAGRWASRGPGPRLGSAAPK
jgi:dihydroxy-acid dehydratase